MFSVQLNKFAHLLEFQLDVHFRRAAIHDRTTPCCFQNKTFSPHLTFNSSLKHKFQGYCDVLSSFHVCLGPTAANFQPILGSSLTVIFRVKPLIAQGSKPTLPYMEHGINATSVTNTKVRILQNKIKGNVFFEVNLLPS